MTKMLKLSLKKTVHMSENLVELLLSAVVKIKCNKMDIEILKVGEVTAAWLGFNEVYNQDPLHTTKILY